MYSEDSFFSHQHSSFDVKIRCLYCIFPLKHILTHTLLNPLFVLSLSFPFLQIELHHHFFPSLLSLLVSAAVIKEPHPHFISQEVLLDKFTLQTLQRKTIRDTDRGRGAKLQKKGEYSIVKNGGHI